jgi:hypothetical protein
MPGFKPGPVDAARLAKAARLAEEEQRARAAQRKGVQHTERPTVKP